MHDGQECHLQGVHEAGKAQAIHIHGGQTKEGSELAVLREGSWAMGHATGTKTDDNGRTISRMGLHRGKEMQRASFHPHPSMMTAGLSFVMCGRV